MQHSGWRENSISHSLYEMGPEDEGRQIKVSGQLRLLQGEGTQGGSLEASEEAVAGPCSPFQPHWGFWR